MPNKVSEYGIWSICDNAEGFNREMGTGNHLSVGVRVLNDLKNCKDYCLGLLKLF